MKNKKIGILGGFGPLAAVEFQKIFFERFKENCNPKSDQDFPEVVVIHACKTPDRVAYILDKNKPDPTPYLQEAISTLENLGCELIVSPCNTVHYFFDHLQTKETTKIVNIIEQGAALCQKNGYKKPLLLATSATIKSAIYEKFFEQKDVSLIKASEADIEKMMQVIYGEKGVKVGYVDENNQNLLAEVVKNYPEADCAILGCTELPLVAQKITIPTIDPMIAASDILIELYAK